MKTLIEQFEAIKSQYSDQTVLLMTRKHYVSYGEECQELALILGITLTKASQSGRTVKSICFPHNFIDLALPKLIKAGKKITVAEAQEPVRRVMPLSNFPEWAVGYVVNGDSTGNEEDDEKISRYLKALQEELHANLIDIEPEDEEEYVHKYFSANPEFGLPCDCIDVNVIYETDK